jgi:arylsulfatase A-like enzyme
MEKVVRCKSMEPIFHIAKTCLPPHIESRWLKSPGNSIPNTTNEYDQGFYSTDYYTKNLLRYFTERTEAERKQPFFAYLPFAAPHWPLQCSPADREKYIGVYDAGPEALRQSRLAALKARGLVANDVVPHDVVAPAIKEFDDMSPRERQLTCRAMEVYAGMVDCIDRNIGKVLAYLEESGELDGECAFLDVMGT